MYAQLLTHIVLTSCTVAQCQSTCQPKATLLTLSLFAATFRTHSEESVFLESVPNIHCTVLLTGFIITLLRVYLKDNTFQTKLSQLFIPQQINVDRLYTSPAIRAQQTSDPGLIKFLAVTTLYALIHVCYI